MARALVTLDDRGWETLSDLLAETLARALRIEAESAERCAAGAAPRRGELGLLLFERR